jgi:hypothetical protein
VRQLGGVLDTITWHEFAMANEDEGETDVVVRLTTLLDIATRLSAAGFPLRLTLTGLAFAAPEEEVADELPRLGIQERFTSTPSRTLAEVCEAIGELHDALRERHLDAEDYGRLSALYWVLGLDTPRAEREPLSIQAEAASG